MNKLLEVYKSLNKKKKKLILRSLLFCMLLLSVNTYAWFIFLDKFDGSINANVIGWDVTFYDDDTSMDNVSLDVNSLYPGMDNYTKDIRVNNNSDLTASFSYELESISIFGTEYDKDDDLEDILNNDFPFKIEFNKSDETISSNGGSANFAITVTWPFESEDSYYKVNTLYSYSSDVDYYKYNGSNYVIDDTVNESNFIDRVKSGIYIESDIADSFWGRKASQFKSLNEDSPCLTLKLKLIVQQIKADN